MFRLLLVTVISALAVTAHAERPDPKQVRNINSIWHENWVGLSNAMLCVATQGGEVATVAEQIRSPTIRLTSTAIAQDIFTNGVDFSASDTG